MALDPDTSDDGVRDRLIEGVTPTDSHDEPASGDAIHDEPVGVTHPARKGGHVTDVPAVAARLTLTDERLVVCDADSDLADCEIRFADIVYVREGQQEINGNAAECLSIRHINPPANAVTTKLRLWDDAAHDRLTAVVTDFYRQRRAAIDELELSTPQLKTLEAAYSAGREFDPATLLSESTEDIAALFGPLRRADLLRTGDTGVFLTGLGHMVVSERVDDERM